MSHTRQNIRRSKGLFRGQRSLYCILKIRVTSRAIVSFSDPRLFMSTSNAVLPPPLRAFAPYFLLVLIVFVFYGNIYGNAFLYDDQHLVVYNQYLQSWDKIGAIFSHNIMSGAGLQSSFYRPIQIFLYLLVYQFCGSSPFGFHFLNIVLHAANTCLLYTLGRKLKFKPEAVLFAALAWGVHPMHTEAVTYISGTADLLHVLFCMLGLLVLVPAFKPRNIGLACFFFVLALLSKEAALVFPGLATLCLFLISEHRKDPKTYIPLWPLWLIAILYGAAHAITSGFGLFDPNLKMNASMQPYATHFLFRLYTSLAALPTYLKILMWPTELHMDRSVTIYKDFWNIEVITGGLIIATALSQVFWNKTKDCLPLSWGLLWWGIAYSPQAGLALPMLTTIREHWMYLPSMGLFLGSAQSAALLLEKRTQFRSQRYGISLCAAGIIMALDMMTYNQNQIWQSPITLYSDSLKYDHSPLMLSNLGNAYIMNNEFDKASTVLHQAITIDDIYPETHMNLAYIDLLTPGQTNTEKAITEIKRALEIDPDFLPAVDLLVNIYEKTGNTEQAATYKIQSEKIRHQLMQ